VSKRTNESRRLVRKSDARESARVRRQSRHSQARSPTNRGAGKGRGEIRAGRDP